MILDDPVLGGICDVWLSGMSILFRAEDIYHSLRQPRSNSSLSFCDATAPWGSIKNLFFVNKYRSKELDSVILMCP